MPPNDRFSPPKKVSKGDIFEAFTERGEDVLNTSEINNHIDHASRSTVRRKLEDMREEGDLDSKKGGMADHSGEVWYLPEERHEIPHPTPDAVKLIYQYPAVWLMLGGLITLGISFIFFLMGYSGQEALFGVIDTYWLRITSVIFLGVGIIMTYIGGGVYIWENIKSLIFNP